MITELEKYLTQVASDKSKHTLTSYQSALTRFCKDMNIVSASQISSLTSANIQDYLYALKDSGLSSSSVNAHARILIAFFNWLKDNGVENDLHAKKFKESKTIKDVPTPEEVKAMIANTNSLSKKFLIALMAFTGMRREEITNIKLSDISGCFITVHGKGRKERKLPLHEDVCKLLNNYLAKRDAEFEYLFYSRKSFAGQGDGQPHQITAKYVITAVRHAMLSAGIAPERIAKMGAHSMRRFFAVYLAKNNASLTKIQLLMGHESATTTAIYLKSAGAEIAEDEIKALPSLM
jgi:site-specific recombinase XerD